MSAIIENFADRSLKEKRNKSGLALNLTAGLFYFEGRRQEVLGLTVGVAF